MVGDSHAMGVTAQITVHMLWTSERTFRVDPPAFATDFKSTRYAVYRDLAQLRIRAARDRLGHAPQLKTGPTL